MVPPIGISLQYILRRIESQIYHENQSHLSGLSQLSCQKPLSFRLGTENETGIIDEGSGTITLYLGLDAGGSHCRARLIDENGDILGTGHAGAANTRIGFENSLNTLKAAWGAAIADAGLAHNDIDRIRAGVGIAGYKRAGAAEAFAAAPHPFETIRFASDAVIANLGAHAGKDGATLIVGTGSIGIIRAHGEDKTIGGYGFPVSDEASGAWIGLEAARHAVLAYDGRTEMGPLARNVLDRFGNDPVAIVRWTDRATATDYAGLAPLVVEAAQLADAGAMEIVRTAAIQIDAFVEALIARGASATCLMGGLGPVLRPWLAPTTRDVLVEPRHDALTGALFLAGWTGLPRG